MDEEKAFSMQNVGSAKNVEGAQATGASDKKTKAEMASIVDLFSFAETTKCKLLIAAGFTLSMVSGASFPEAFEDISQASSGLGPVREVAYSFLILGVIILFSMLGQAVCIELAALEMTKNLKMAWFRALLRQDIAYFDVLDVAGEATIISTNANKYKKGMGTKLTHISQSLTTFVCGIAYAFWSDWKISLAVLAVAPLMVLSAMFIMKMNTSVTSRANASYAKAGGIVSASVNNIRTVLSLNAVDLMINRFKGATKEAFDGAVSQVAWQGLANGCNMASMLCTYVIVVLLGSYLIYDQVRENGCDPSGGIPDNEKCSPAGVNVFGALMGITFAAMILPQISAAFEALYGARAACYPAMMVIRRTTGRTSQEVVTGRGGAVLPQYQIDSSSKVGKKPEFVSGSLEFQNVSFAYPTRPNYKALNDFTLKINPGTTVALVGTSGSGKSTTVQLIERFYDPLAGRILFDGNDLRSLNIRWWRKQVAFVQQEPKLFDLSIKENIALGCEGFATDEQIHAAAKKANAHDFIMSFPDGYDTEVGSLGDKLSGGQRQRICIARSLIAEPSVLLLDEATSALDTESERFVQSALDELMRLSNMTTVVIAHRLSTIRNADVIGVVRDGEIVELGTHEELLAKNGQYFQLVEAQNIKPSTTANDESTPLGQIPDESEHGCQMVEQDKSRLVDINNCHFSYPSRPGAVVLSGFNLTVYEGETLALVGPSGCGKSTIVQLLECFYHVNSGSIKFKGIDLKDINVKWLRDQIGLVSQQPVLFDCSIEENIKCACPNASHDEVVQAAKKANAHDFILGFSDGYNTQVGEGSTLISGGQKQRICIARALLKKPKLLLLDEATSALDSSSENIVQAALDEIMKDSTMTCITIAHRLSTIQNADRIAVVGHGKIREIGTHDELMAREGGLYKRMQSLQSLEARKDLVPAEAVPKPIETTNHEEKTTEYTETEIDKEQEAANAKRARNLALSVIQYFILGGVGAFMGGGIFVSWGFVFAYMIEVLYRPVLFCDDSDPANDCALQWENEAEAMKEMSLKIFYGFMGIIAMALVGFTAVSSLFGSATSHLSWRQMYWGFGVGTESINRKVRDEAFQNMLRQEVGWFDMKSSGWLTSRLAEDAAILHAFIGEPIRTLSSSLSSVFVGIIVSFVYMWPVALMTIAILPFMAYGAMTEMEIYYGSDDNEKEELKTGSPGAIVAEALINIRTVASLTLEEERATTYQEALERENKSPILPIVKKGGTVGLGQFVQMWGTALLFWWGSWLINRYSNVFDYRGFLISLFGLLFSLYGLAIAAEGAVGRSKANAAASRIFDLMDRQSAIDPLSDKGVRPFSDAPFDEVNSPFNEVTA